jgi:hypothetical protein
MPARYSVIQYVPDPATDERINFGVLAFGSGELHARFVKDWRRIARFGGPDIAFLRGFAREVERVASGQTSLVVAGTDTLNENVLLEAAGKWMNSIQLTTPRASTLDPAALADQTAARFLRARMPQIRRGRDRRAAAGAASRSLAAALRAEGSRRPEKYVRRNEVVEGALDEHHLDVALANGSPQWGVLAMSFESGNASELGREVRANAWTLDDVSNAKNAIPIAVVTLPPLRGHSKTYDHAVELFESLEAEVVEEKDLGPWAEEVAQEVYDDLVGR